MIIKCIPKLRFNKFNNKYKWNTCALRDVTSPISGNNGNVRGVPILTISAAHGWMNQKDRFSKVIAGKQLRKYTLLKQGQLSYNHGNSKRAKYGCVFVLNNYKEALVPRIYHSFKSNGKSNPQFLNYLFSSKIPDRELRKMVTSSARNDGLLNINKKSFFSIRINIPSLPEQRLIGRFFAKLDKLINLQRSKVDLLKKQKRGYLQKMFPKKDDSIPVLRFKRMDNCWKSVKLGSIFKKIRRRSKPSKHISYWSLIVHSGLVPKTKRYNRKFLIKRNIFDVVHPGDFVYNPYNMTLGTIDYNKTNHPIYVSKYYIIMVADMKYDKYFLATYLTSSHALRLYRKYATGTLLEKQVLRYPLFANIFLRMPSLVEQRKIGHFFKKMDDGIDLQSNKLNYFHELKKAYLQKMFC